MEDYEKARKRGEFEGMVTAKLDALSQDIKMLLVGLKDHAEADDKIHEAYNERISWLERWMYRLLGAGSVLSVILTMLQAIVIYWLTSKF